MHILLAEDDKISRDLLRRILESEAHTVELATDGEAAWAILRDSSRQFDACVFDICMPTVSGIDLLERMRAQEAHRRTPVILCTALSDRSTVERAAALGVSHYVVKPYNRTVMLEKLRQIRVALEEGDSAETAAAVCQRLGIDSATHRETVETLLADAGQWSGLLRGNADPTGFQTFFIRARGIKGSCLSLGLRPIAQKFNRLETLLETQLAQPAQTVPFPPEVQIGSLLDELDAEIRNASERMKASV